MVDLFLSTGSLGKSILRVHAFMKKRQASMWVLVHCEFMGPKESSFVDSLVWHVSSSRAKAEAYVRSIWTCPFSWWELRRFVVDCTEHEIDDQSQVSDVLIYSHRGRRLRSAPRDQARKAWMKELAQRKKQGLDY